MPEPRDQNLKFALAIVPDATIAVDRDGKILQASDQVEALFGYLPSELRGRQVEILIPEKLRAGHVHLRAGFLANPARRAMGSGLALRGLRKDRSEIPIEISLNPIEEGLVICTIRDATARQGAEAVLQKAIVQLKEQSPARDIRGPAGDDPCRLFVERAPTAVAMFDRDMRFVVASTRWCEEFGIDAPELSGRRLSDALPDAPEGWKDAAGRALSGEDVRKREDRFRRANGETAWLDWEIHPWRNAAGEIGGAVVFCEFVTRRKQAELELRSNRSRLEDEVAELKRLNRLIERLWRPMELHAGLEEILAASIALMKADKGNVQLMGEDGTLRIDAQRGFGDEFLAAFAAVTNEDGSACGQALRTGERIVFEDVETVAEFAPFREIARRAGFRAVQSTPLVGYAGKALGMLSTHFAAPHRPDEQDLRRLDVYARLAAAFVEYHREEAALKANRSILEAALSNMSDAIAISNRDGDLVEFNDAFARYLRFPDKPNCLRAFRDFRRLFDVTTVDGIAVPFDQWPIPRALRGETGVNVEWSLRRRDTGETWSGSHNFAPIRDAAGTVIGTVLTARDITERRRIDKAHLSAQEKLESQVADRTRAVEAARNEAQRASHQKTNFLTAVSHDLRQPLQSISALLGLLGKLATEAESRAIIDRIDDSIRHMVDMIDTLLDIGQIESGEIRPEISEFPVAAVLKRKSAEFAALAAAKGIELRFVYSSAVVRSDPHLLERMVGNLLSNAVKYTDVGRILLGCRRRRGSLRIEVWDTGIGIASEELKRIFTEFYRIDPGKSSEVGLGLGLYFVERIGSLLGHAVNVRSTPGRGTMFSIRVPMTRARAARRHETGRRKPYRPIVLMVEDDALQLRGLGALLRREGYDVLPVRRGEDALSLLRERKPLRPDAIVCDFDLGGPANGIEVVDTIRQEFHTDIPALILTGDRSRSVRRRIELARLGYIGKPARAERFVEAVDDLVRKSRPDWERPHTIDGRPAVRSAPAPAERTIGVVDDEPTVRDSLRAMLVAEGYGVSAYASSEALLADPHRDGLDCLIVDLGLPGADGLALLARLKAQSRRPPVIFLTGRSSLQSAVKAMQEGAVDFLRKPVPPKELLASIERAFSTAPAQKPKDDGSKDTSPDAKLTPREHQVLRGMLDGKPNKVIAADLGISTRTTEHHRERVMRKMGAKSLAELVRMFG